MNILVVEDERNLADAIVRIVSEASDTADAVYDGRAGLRAACSGRYDAVVLDVMLPGMDGREVVHEMRRQGVATPVLMLTARTSTADKVEGLDAGADDYMTKPFEADVMLDEVAFADVTLDLATHDLSCGQQSVHLSGKEFEVMRILMGSSPRVVSKQDLLARVWGDVDASENSVEAYVSFLRKKLAHIGSAVQITTLRMLGYRLEVLEG